MKAFKVWQRDALICAITFATNHPTESGTIESKTAYVKDKHCLHFSRVETEKLSRWLSKVFSEIHTYLKSSYNLNTHQEHIDKLEHFWTNN